MDTNDYCATPQELKDQLSERYSGARRAYLKSGGDFPFLSRPDEVNLHLQLHLRRVGVEAQPDLVRGISKDGNGGSPSQKNDEKDEHEDPPNHDEGDPDSPSADNQSPPAPESSKSSEISDQFLSNAKICPMNHEDKKVLMHFASLMKQHATTILLSMEIFVFCLLPLYVESLYIASGYCLNFRQFV
ncbi:hypothetical protein SLEP1_g46071 [Rubroshorea leprosula]|uniref:Uncharacterized protein n=1 Tax=Rubroshorea leprosula TaxID=152421 RepID=A0AAV5LN04_9ROSI|nr:hypothetical protein SLEP1_g46071 [Rubroshorea leprosula]